MSTYEFRVRTLSLSMWPAPFKVDAFPIDPAIQEITGFFPYLQAPRCFFTEARYGEGKENLMVRVLGLPCWNEMLEYWAQSSAVLVEGVFHFPTKGEDPPTSSDCPDLISNGHEKLALAVRETVQLAMDEPQFTMQALGFWLVRMRHLRLTLHLHGTWVSNLLIYDNGGTSPRSLKAEEADGMQLLQHVFCCMRVTLHSIAGPSNVHN